MTVGPLLLLLCASAAASALPTHPELRAAAPPPPKKGCHGGSCGGMAHYPTGPGIAYEAVFDVPGKPQKTDGICYYIYFNIFFSRTTLPPGLLPSPPPSPLGCPPPLP